MAGVAIVSWPPVAEDIARAPITADLHTPMADQATARDTGLLHAQAYDRATYTPTSDDRVADDRVADVPAVDSRAADSPAGDVQEAVAQAVPDNWL